MSLNSWCYIRIEKVRVHSFHQKIEEIRHDDQHTHRRINHQIKIRRASSKSSAEHETTMRCTSSSDQDKSCHENADIQLTQRFHVRCYLRKSSSSVLNSDKSEMTFEVLTWHQRSKKEKLSSKERRLEILQNQALRHVTDAFKRVNIETLKMKIYMNSLHVHLNKIQNQTTLRS